MTEPQARDLAQRIAALATAANIPDAGLRASHRQAHLDCLTGALVEVFPEPALAPAPPCTGDIALGRACLNCPRCARSLLELLFRLRDTYPCDYDHHGYCQAHGLHRRPCPQENIATLAEQEKRT